VGLVGLVFLLEVRESARPFLPQPSQWQARPFPSQSVQELGVGWERPYFPPTQPLLEHKRL